LVEHASPNYKYLPVVTVEGAAIVHYHCVERLSDSQFAVVHTEFHGGLTEPEKTMAELLTPFIDLGIMTSDEANWTFYGTVQEAIAANKDAMESYANWMKNAQNM
jgi:hypothetical protein